MHLFVVLTTEAEEEVVIVVVADVDEIEVEAEALVERIINATCVAKWATTRTIVLDWRMPNQLFQAMDNRIMSVQQPQQRWRT
jgi:hypothetical protein